MRGAHILCVNCTCITNACGIFFAWLQEKHVEEVIKANEQLSKSKYSEEKVFEKIQKAIKNRENFLQEQRNRLREHVRCKSMANCSGIVKWKYCLSGCSATNIYSFMLHLLFHLRLLLLFHLWFIWHLCFVRISSKYALFCLV